MASFSRMKFLTIFIAFLLGVATAIVLDKTVLSQPSFASPASPATMP